MRLDWLTTLYGYNRWANGRILETCDAIAPDAYTAAGDAGYGSIRDTLVHTAWAEWIWLSRWRGVSPRERWNPADFPDVAILRTRWQGVADDMTAHIDRLTEADLPAAITYASTSGGTRTQPLWEMLLHQALHAGQHRAEAAYLMTRAGHSPGDLDMLRYQLNRPNG